MVNLHLALVLADLTGVREETFDDLLSARSMAIARTAEKFQSFMPPGTPMLGIINGNVDLDDIIRDALRAADEIQTSVRPSDTAEQGF